MFNFFKRFFYKKECYACKSLLEKIKCVREHLLVDPYSQEYRGLRLRFIHDNIDKTIKDLKLLKSNIKIERYNIPNISESNIKELSINRWFTDDNKNILNDTDDKWKEYLDLYIWLIEWFDENNKDITNPRYGVSLKLKPYIINIQIVIDALIEFQKQEIDM